MAKCEKREARPLPPPVEYVLTLSDDEARVLKRMLCSGKWPFTRDAFVLQALHELMRDVGVK